MSISKLDPRIDMNARSERNKRSQIVTSIIIVFLSLVVLFFSKSISYYFYFPEFYILLFGLIAVMVGISPILKLYLSGRLFVNYNNIMNKMNVALNNDEEEQQISDTINKTEILSRLKEIEDNLVKISENKLSISSEDKSGLLKTLKESVLSSIIPDIISDIEVKYSEKIHDSSKRKSIVDIFISTKSRLNSEIYSLKRKSITNLMIGSLTTLSAGIVLAFMAINDTSNLTDILSLLKHYIPKLSVIVFIEIFAFFFLKLYKNNLSEIKYYQNEMTNVESKFQSLQIALLINDNEAIRNVITEYSIVDRNIFNAKLFSTEEIEKSKMEKDKLDEIIKLLPKIIEKLK